MSRYDQAVALLSELVACPSMNPGDRPAVGPPFGEAALARKLDGLLSGWGAATEIQDVLPGRPNFIATFTGRDDSRSIMFEAHADTVTAADPAACSPAHRAGRLYGLGACDTKGPMTAMLLGIRDVLDSDGKPPVTVYFVSTCDEEAGASGARVLIERGFRTDAAIVGEPTDLAVIHAHKGVLRFRIATHGVAAHSSEPGRGVNAIYKMAPILRALEEAAASFGASRRHPLLGGPTLSVGVIRGGTLVNVVPDSCEIDLDRRLIPGETREDVTADMRRVLSGIASRDAGPAFTLTATQYYPVLNEDAAGPLPTLVCSAYRAAIGEPKTAVAPYGTNAGVFRDAGIPSVVLGPGSIAQAHTRDEFIDVKQVVTAAAVYAEIIRRFASDSNTLTRRE